MPQDVGGVGSIATKTGLRSSGRRNRNGINAQEGKGQPFTAQGDPPVVSAGLPAWLADRGPAEAENPIGTLGRGYQCLTAPASIAMWVAIIKTPATHSRSLSGPFHK